jgi:AcrR family transcriptional regulator
MRRTQAERTANTRAALLSATVQCLGEHGYRGTSNAVICRQAGVSRGALLHHYPTKAALFADSVEHLFRLRIKGLRRVVVQSRPGPERLDRVLDELWSIYSGPALMAWFELVVVARTDPELQAQMAATATLLETEAAEVFQDAMGLPEHLQARPIVRMVMALMDGLALHASLHQDPCAVADSQAIFRALVAPWVAPRPGADT